MDADRGGKVTMREFEKGKKIGPESEEKICAELGPYTIVVHQLIDVEGKLMCKKTVVVPGMVW